MANCCLVVSHAVWSAIGILGVLVAYGTSFWMSPNATGGLFFFTPARVDSHAGLWQTCVTDPPVTFAGTDPPPSGTPPGSGSALQDAEGGATAVWDTIRTALPWANNTGCSSDVATFYSNLEVPDPSTGTTSATTISTWEIVIAERVLLLVIVALSFVLVIVVASHNSERGCSKGFAHVVAFVQFATSVTAAVLWIVLLVRLSKYDPTAGTSADGEWAAARAYLSNLDTNVEQGFSSLNNWWGWSYWCFVASAAWLFVGNFLVCCM